MKAKLKGKIKAMGPSLNESASMVVVAVDLEGQVSEAKSPEAKKVFSKPFTFEVKALIAQELKYGQEIFVTVSTEEGA